METKELKKGQKALFPPLREEDIEVRVDKFTADGKKLRLLLYKNGVIDGIMLDTIVGKYNWQKKNVRYFAPDGTPYLDCEIKIRTENGDWISRDGTGEESNFEPKKGQETDAMKRAGFAFGIGRELKNHPPVIEIEAECLSTEPSANTITLENGNTKTFYKTYDDFSVTQIVYADEEYESRRIVQLAIKNDTTGKIVFTYDEKSEFEKKREIREKKREESRSGKAMAIPSAPKDASKEEKKEEATTTPSMTEVDEEPIEMPKKDTTPSSQQTATETLNVAEETENNDTVAKEETDSNKSADYLNVIVNFGKYNGQPLSAVPKTLIYSLFCQIKISEEVKNACVLYSLNDNEVAKCFKSEGRNPKSLAKERGLIAA